MKIDYIVHAPDYVSNSAGVRCLYVLADELNRRGYSTYVTGSVVAAPDLNAPLMPLSRARRYATKIGFTVIYPETVAGNPVGGKLVARWVLNRPGLLGGEEVYDLNDKIFIYSDVYANYVENPILGKLYMPTIDQNIFFPPAVEGIRSMECYYVGKSTFKDGFFDKNSVFEITRTSPGKSELGKLFRASKVLYCFDNSTILAYEAAMCGCPVVIIPDGTQTKQDYEKLELGMNGVAWGMDDFERAKNTVHLMNPFYEKAKQNFQDQIDKFISLTAPKTSLADRLDLRATQSAIETASSSVTSCKSCAFLQREVEELNQEIFSFRNSRYFLLREQIDEKFPRLKHFLTWTAHSVFNVIYGFSLRNIRSPSQVSRREENNRRKLLRSGSVGQAES